jgi:hypothetical protein
VACLSITTSPPSDRMQTAGAGRGRAAAFLAFAIAAVVLALAAGCGQGGLAYSSSQYRFALTYDAALTPTDHVTPGVLTGDKPAHVIAFLDPAAPRADGRYVDGVWVAVMRLRAGAHWPASSAMAAELRHRLTAAVVHDMHGSVTQALARTANGLPAWVVGYDYRLGGTAIRALTYVLVKGDYEYQVTLQAAAARWPQMLPRLALSVSSFTVR